MAYQITQINKRSYSVAQVAGVVEVPCIGDGQYFDGLFDYLYYDDNGIFDIAESSTYYSISAKIKTGTNITDLQYVLGKMISTTDDYKFGFYIISGNLYAHFKVGAGHTVLYAIAQSTSYDVAMIFDLVNRKMFFYVDGIVVNVLGEDYTGDFGNLDNAFKFYIGCGNGGTGDATKEFNGYVNNVRIFHSDIRADLANIIAGERIGNELGLWCLTNGNFNDLSGNGYDLSDTIGVEEPPDDISANYVRLSDFLYKMQQGSMVNDGTDLYFIGGQHYNSRNESPVLVKYNIVSDEWTLLSIKPGFGYQSIGFVNVGSKLYHVGGLSGGVTYELYEYDIATDTWTLLSPMPTPREDMACVADSRYIYVVGGWDAVNIRAELEIYDTLTDTWDSTKSDIPIPVCLGNNGVLYNGFIYVISGNSDMSTYPTFTSSLKVQRYNIATDTWDTVQDILEGGSYMECVVDAGKIYALGGVVSRVTPTNQTLSKKLKIYDIASNTWSYDPDEFKTIRGYGMTILNSKLYIATGNYSNDSVYLASKRFYEKSI